MNKVVFKATISKKGELEIEVKLLIMCMYHVQKDYKFKPFFPKNCPRTRRLDGDTQLKAYGQSSFRLWC